jgi:hypothetical protein
MIYQPLMVYFAMWLAMAAMFFSSVAMIWKNRQGPGAEAVAD